MWPNPWEHNSCLVRMRRAQPLSELKRKADKATRIKGKIWTVEELDYSYILGKQWAIKLIGKQNVRGE